MSSDFRPMMMAHYDDKIILFISKFFFILAVIGCGKKSL